MKPIGPYSPFVKVKDFVFTSGQLPVNPQTGTIADDNIEGQLRQALYNLSEVIKESGAALKNIVKVNLYLTSLNNFTRVNEVYQEFFGIYCPARTCVQVAKLPKDALVEVDAIAVIA